MHDGSGAGARKERLADILRRDHARRPEVIGLLALAAAASVPCGNLSNQAAMTECQGQAARRADAAMNAVWKRLLPQMRQADAHPDDPDDPALRKEPGYAQSLVAAQRAWLAWRDQECRIESYEWRGGTMQSYSENECMEILTRERTRQLGTMLKWSAQ
jgi:uncharacterized protein YecT (DUF1311 family)